MAKQEKILIAIDLDRSAADAQIQANAKALRALKGEAISLNKELKEGKITEDEFTKAILENQKAQAGLKGETKQLENSLKATNNTVEGLRARISALTAESNKMDLNSEEFTKAQDELKDLNEQLIAIGKGRANFKDNVGNYASSIEGLEERLASLTKTAKGMDLGSAEFKATQKELQAVKNQLNDASEALNKTEKNTISVADGLDKVAPGLGSATAGLKGMTRAALAFIATPIGAVIAALGLAVAAVTRYFQSSEEGQNKFAKISRTVSIILGNLSDVLSEVGKNIIEAFENPKQIIDDFGKSITGWVGEIIDGLGLMGKSIKLLFQGEFSAAADAASAGAKKLVMNATPIGLAYGVATAAVDGFNKVLKESQSEIEQGLALEDLKAQTDVLERQLIVQKSVNEAKIAENKLRAEDKSLDIEDRTAALQEALRLQDELSKMEETVARNRFEIKKTENSFSNSTKEDLMEQAQLEAELFRIQKDNADKKKEIFIKDQELQKQLLQISINDSIAVLERQLLQTDKFSNEEFKLQQKLIQQKRDAALQGQQVTEAQRQLIIAQAYAEEQELLTSFLQTQKDLRLKSLEETEQTRAVLLEQSYLNGEIKEEEYHAKLFEIREEALELEIEQLEEGSLVRLEKETELAQIRADRLNDIKEKALEDERNRAAAEREIDQLRLNSAKDVTDGVIALAGEKSIAGKAALAIQKGIALAEVAMNLASELSNVGKADSIFPTPVGPALIATRTIAAIIRAASSTAKIASVTFADGGVDGNMASSGGFMHRLGGMISGRAHGEGGVKFRMRNGRWGEADGKKGEAYIVNTRNDPRLKAMASAINVAGGGRPFYSGDPFAAARGIKTFAYGGVDSAGIAGPGPAPSMSLTDVLDVVSNLPAPRVLVDDIDTGLSTKVMIEDGGTI